METEQVILRAFVSFFWPRKNAEERRKSHGDGSVQCSVIAKSARWDGWSRRAEGISGVPGCSAQRKLRPPSIEVNTSGDAVCSCAQDFALILFLAAEKRGRTQKIAWVGEFSVFSHRKVPPLGRMLPPSRGNQWRAGVFGSA